MPRTDTAAMTTYMIPKGPITHSAGLPGNLTFNDNLVGKFRFITMRWVCM